MSEEPRAGWRVNAWAEATGISIATIYRLMERGELRSAKFGNIRMIMESPRDFLERHAVLSEPQRHQ